MQVFKSAVKDAAEACPSDCLFCEPHRVEEANAKAGDKAGEKADEAGDKADEAGDKADEAGDKADEAGDKADDEEDEEDDGGERFQNRLLGWVCSSDDEEDDEAVKRAD